MTLLRTAAALACTLFAGVVSAQETPEDAKVQAFLGSLQYRTGDIALPTADAHLAVRPGFRYLGHDDSRRVLEEYWGNPPDDSILGMLVPEDAPLGSDHSWAVVITFSDDGYVSDEDAGKIDYAALLTQLKEDTKAENETRKKDGYGGINLIGWAQAPSYDATGKRLHWAKEIAFDDADHHVLNYDIRVLGRKGYLSMNAVADMADLGLVRQGMTEVLPMAKFDAGQTYADYKPGSDKLAGYGLAALVGGGIAAKTGLFAKLGVLLLGMKKGIVILLAGLAALVKKFFGGSKDDRTVR